LDPISVVPKTYPCLKAVKESMEWMGMEHDNDKEFFTEKLSNNGTNECYSYITKNIRD